MIIVALLASFVVGFSLGLWVVALYIGSLVRQHGGRYTFSLSEAPSARPTTPQQTFWQ